MKFIIGTKLDMTQDWQGDNVVAVTRVKAEPCVIVQLKNKEKDGYEAVQLGFGVRKEKNINKPQKNHYKKLGNFAKTREFRATVGDLKIGDKIGASTFEVGDIIQVVGTSKGKGFQGSVKRHGFSGSKMTHGNKDQQRMPGSVGAKGPARIFKGIKMPGRMGGERVTVKNLEILKIDVENNILYIKGAVPGCANGLLLVSGEGELKILSEEKTTNKETTETKIKAEPVTENNSEPVAESKSINEVELSENKEPDNQLNKSN
jgi:large subunit ribosomal protein L3